jgi:formylmethanofuran dehydrogenase subunit D
MPYVASQDTYKQSDSAADPSKNMVLITPADSDLVGPYPKALRVYSASGCVVVVTPARAADDSVKMTLTYPSGLYCESLVVRRVWTTGTTGSPTIHGYQDA